MSADAVRVAVEHPDQLTAAVRGADPERTRSVTNPAWFGLRTETVHVFLPPAFADALVQDFLQR